MGKPLHEKWASVTFVKDRDNTDVLTHRAVTLSPSEMDPVIFIDDDAGSVIMFAAPDKDNKIIEVTLGRRADDWIGAMYEPNPIFNSPATLREARTDLITMIEDTHEAPPGSMQGLCRARNRSVDLREMPTIQLIDILKRIVAERG